MRWRERGEGAGGISWGCWREPRIYWQNQERQNHSGVVLSGAGVGGEVGGKFDRRQAGVEWRGGGMRRLGRGKELESRHLDPYKEARIFAKWRLEFVARNWH